MRISYSAGVLLLVLAVTRLSPAQHIRARVIDEASRAPIAGAIVTASNDRDVARTASNPDGFFTITLPSLGKYTLTVHSVGYREQARSLTAETVDSITIPAFLLIADAIPLSRVEATAIRKRVVEEAGFNRASFLIAGSTMARLERQAVSMVNAIRTIGAGVRIRYMGRNRAPCIESTRRITSLRPDSDACDMVIIVVDEIVINDPGAFLRSARLENFESMQYVPPAEAAQRYGLEASAKGAVVFWSRGRGPHQHTDRNAGR